MSPKDRKQRQFSEREQCFLAKASEMIEQDGLLKLQMQRLARACEYSVGTLYQHFKSKEDMLTALLTLRVNSRLELFQRVSRWQACNRDRMLGFIFADLLFARRDPLFFQLHQYLSTPIIAATITPECRDAAILAHQPLSEVFINVIDEAVEAGDVSAEQLSSRQLGVGLWALSEGIHTLAHSKGLSEAFRVDSPYLLLLHHTHALLNGLNWLPLYPLDDTERQEAIMARMFSEVFSDFSQAEVEPFFVKTK